jgi:hypothetical protein
MGVATNMLTPRFVSYLENRRLIKSNRSQEQDIAAYRRVEAFKNGSRDRYATYIALSALSVIFAIGGATCVLLLALKYGDLNGGGLLVVDPITFALILLTAMLFLTSFLFIAIIITTARRIERFDEYTTEIRAKWGNDAI